MRSALAVAFAAALVTTVATACGGAARDRGAAEERVVRAPVEPAASVDPRAGVPAECQPTRMPPGAAGHQHLEDPRYDVVAVLEPTPCLLLQAQLDVARAAAARYPTVAHAVRDGYRMLGPYVEGVAAHYVDPSIYDTRFDPSEPEFLLFLGTEPASRLVGLSYAALRSGAPPEFFVGPNDHAHRHAFCGPPLPIDAGIPLGEPGCTEENAVGVRNWFIHVWVVPGHDSPYGVFSPVHPYLTPRGWDPQNPIAPVDDRTMARVDAQVAARLARGGGPVAHSHHGAAQAGH